jgi:PAS domain-containing protein
VFPGALDTLSHEKLNTVMRERVPVHFETQSIVNGNWIEVQAFPKADGGISVLYHDIGERKQIEERLRDSEEVSRLALAAGRAGTWSWDLHTNDLHWSNEFYEIFGLEPGSTTPTLEGGFARIHPDDQSSVAALVERVLAGDHGFDETYRVIRAVDSRHGAGIL